jgi:hypothetical protein
LSVTDDELTDRWEAGHVFAGGITHEQHLRIAWVLHRRHGPREAKERLLVGTRQACQRHGCPEKFDPALTERWSDEVAAKIHANGFEASADAFLRMHPSLRRGSLLGRPRLVD